MLSVIMLSAIMSNVVLLSAMVLSSWHIPPSLKHLVTETQILLLFVRSNIFFQFLAQKYFLF
jgi:hypothetical protein